MSFSSSSSTPKFDVLLSCAEDTRKGLVSHLNHSLTQRGIKTYFSDDKPEKRTIESKVVVVVVSQSYPASVLCLDELCTILTLLDKGRLLVLPIFYGVDPSNVRNQMGEGVETFQKLGEAYPEKVQEWRNALIELTNLFPQDLHTLSGQAEMVENITQRVEVLLGKSDKSIEHGGAYPITNNISGLVGLDRQMQALYRLFDLKCNQDVRLIGIWGPGGVGKTTLARFAYENISNNFNAHVFVENAENIYQQECDESCSQETFTSGKIQEWGQNVSTGLIKSTVGHRKGLLVIDGVDNIKHLKNIAEIIYWCGFGSRVILITQDKKLLDEFGVKHVYEVESLRYDEAVELFSQSAFNKRNPPTSFESLSLRAVQIASFLPLTLKILGSSLQCKIEEEWEKKLKELEGEKEKAIMKIMKKSYIRENEEDLMKKSYT